MLQDAIRAFGELLADLWGLSFGDHKATVERIAARRRKLQY